MFITSEFVLWSSGSCNVLRISSDRLMTSCRSRRLDVTQRWPSTKPRGLWRSNETTVLIRSDIGQAALDLAARPLAAHPDYYCTTQRARIGCKGTRPAGI